jgi:hypothetical protein
MNIFYNEIVILLNVIDLFEKFSFIKGSTNNGNI